MSDQLFNDLTHFCESDEQITQIESLCLQCGGNGMTKIMLTEIPFFKQVVVMSFECPHCGNSNNELQPAQTIGPKGIRIVVKCETQEDLMRSVVKTEWAHIEIPEIEFEVSKQTGLITTVEGILERAIDALKQSYESNINKQMNDFLTKLDELRNGKQKFTFILTDISGNSFIESVCAPQTDPRLEINYFIRGIEEDKILGIYEAIDGEKSGSNECVDSSLNDEVLQFATNCSNCNSPVFTNMKTTQIPHFKQVVIMATNCDSCGYKTNEVKSGAGIEDKGIRIVVKVNNENDLNKEVVKSDMCSIQIPELKIEISSSGSGRYTTIEGIAENIKEELKKSNPFIDGDSSKQEIREKLSKIYDKLSNLIGYTIILDDPSGNSYVEEPTDVIRYERSYEQNEELGLNDIKTENYS